MDSKKTLKVVGVNAAGEVETSSVEVRYGWMVGDWDDISDEGEEYWRAVSEDGDWTLDVIDRGDRWEWQVTHLDTPEVFRTGYRSTCDGAMEMAESILKMEWAALRLKAMRD